MRLIDAYALPRHGKRKGFVYSRDIDSAPTIDPVKHGAWIREPFSGVIMFWRCNKCMSVASISSMEPAIKYCPNCGARMDGGICD